MRDVDIYLTSDIAPGVGIGALSGSPAGSDMASATDPVWMLYICSNLVCICRELLHANNQSIRTYFLVL